MKKMDSPAFKLIRTITFVIMVSLRLAAAGPAQVDWAMKAFSQWSKSEAEKVLNDSPWTKVQEAREFFGTIQQAAGSGGPINSWGAPVDTKIKIRLRSALPIRQALVRLKQIEAKYDKLDDRSRAAFDVKTKGLLECPACADKYVVTLSAKSELDPGFDAIYRLLGGANLPRLQKYIYLMNDRGDRRELIHFVPPKQAGDEATFFFPRFDEKGAPLITAASKKLIFRFSDVYVSSIMNFEFDVSKLTLNGEVAF